jgi:hypothetical protein
MWLLMHFLPGYVLGCQPHIYKYIFLFDFDFFYLSCELFELNKYIRRQNIFMYYYLSIIIWPFLTVWYFNLSHLQQE